MKKYKLTVFTPTYNRAHTLPRLYASLLSQGYNNDFEWLIIDDASTDGTECLVKNWMNEARINIDYIKLERNGGKPRAINRAVTIAKSPFLFIIDSDDYMAPGTIEFLIDKVTEIADVSNIAGVGVMQKHHGGICFARPVFSDFVDATNLQRRDYGLDFDCNEAYKTEVLGKYHFEVWPGENFTPEETVLNAMAFDGYKIRWYNRIGVISEYCDDGLTKGAWNLQRRNPMGYAILYNSKLRHVSGFGKRFSCAAYMTAQSLLGGHPEYLLRSNAPWLTLLAFPVGIAVYFRRLWQYRSA